MQSELSILVTSTGLTSFFQTKHRFDNALKIKKNALVN